MAGWIIGGLMIAVVTAFFVSRARSYGRLFANEHFIEIGRGASGLKVAAVANVIQSDSDQPRSPNDPRILTTSAGLAIVYTVRKHQSDFVHHCSVSMRGGYTANAVGGTFVVFVMKLVGMPVERAGFEIGASTVHHGEVTLDQAEHDDLVTAPTPDISASNVAEFRRAALEARNGIDWKGVASPG
jgi:hypothetical protein